MDDNRDGVLARRAVLEELGYQVRSAECGSEALDLVARENIDLVITDYRMSPVDGLQLIALLRERQFTKPIILLTGFADNLGMRVETTGADAVIQKSANEITTLLRNAKRLLSAPKKPAASQTRKLVPRKRASGEA